MILYKYHPQKAYGEFFMGYVYTEDDYLRYNWRTRRLGHPDRNELLPVFVHKTELLAAGWRFRRGNLYSPTDENLIAEGMRDEIISYDPIEGTYTCISNIEEISCG